MLGQLFVILIGTCKGVPPRDDTRCLGIAPKWMRWPLAALLFVGAGDGFAGRAVDYHTMSKIPGYETLLGAAQLNVASEQIGSLPWEGNPLMSSIFGTSLPLVPEWKRPMITHEVSNASTSSNASGLAAEMRSRVKKAVPRIKPETAHLISNDPEAGRQQATND